MNGDDRWPFIALLVLVAVLLVGPLMMGVMMGPGVMWGGPGQQPPPGMTSWG